MGRLAYGMVVAGDGDIQDAVFELNKIHLKSCCGFVLSIC